MPARGGRAARQPAAMAPSRCPRPVLPQIYSEGMHFKLPWFEKQVVYDVRARPSLIQSSSGSRDLQTVRGPARGPPSPLRAARSLDTLRSSR